MAHSRPASLDHPTIAFLSMKHSVASLAPRFSACRAMRQYADEAYGEAAEVSL